MHFSRPALLFIGLTVLALIVVIGIAAWPWVAHFTSDNTASGAK